MNEQKLIRRQLIKNMFYAFIVFAVILIFLYNQVSISLYKSIDEELIRTAQIYQNIGVTSELKKNVLKN